MTNRENIKKVIDNDFDKKDNYEKIIEGIYGKKNQLNYKYVIIPLTAVIILVLIVGLSVKNNKVKQFEKFGGDGCFDEINAQTSSNNNNYIDTSDSERVEINEINGMIKNRNNIKVVNNVNIPYFEMLTNLEIPEDFQILEDYRAVYVKSDGKTTKDDFVLNNYEFHYRNNKSEREIVVSFSKDFIPISNYNFGVKNTLSLINGISVGLYKYEKNYIAKFQYMKYNFLIEGKGITQEEFMNFLISIIK